ncbi:hypothetical protein [Eggerthella lenta]|uniref:hypothetical protein n=1 Tax=Eggerthella lenta TaxID=84112 RepID=UPI003DA3DFBE
MAKDRQPMQLDVGQRFLGPRALVWAIASINIVANLAIDMFVPALPTMQAEFGAFELG